MARSSIKDKLTERNNKVNLTKHDMRYGWYYVQINESGKMQVIQTDEPNLDNLIKSMFGATLPDAIALSTKDIYLLTCSKTPMEDGKPNVYVKNTGYYGDSLIACLLDKESLTNIQPVPYALAMHAIECLRFAKGKLPSIEVLPLNN